MVQKATKKETLRIAAGTGIGVVLMVIAFAVLHAIVPEQVPFDYKVVLGGIGGGLIAVLNFFLMGLTVQKVAKTTDDKLAYSQMKASYSQRMMLQILWIIASLVIPVFNGAAGIIPLLFPSLTVKLYYLLLNRKAVYEQTDDKEAGGSPDGETELPQDTAAASDASAAEPSDPEEERSDRIK